MARRQSSHRGGVSRPRVSVARNFDPVLTASPVGSVSTRGSRRSVASNGTPKNRRTRRRTRVTEVEASVAGVNDNWTPPPKRDVKVARDTLLRFYETMDAQRKVAEEDDEFSALRDLVPKGGDRGRFLKTLGYSADPPEFNAGHPFSHHAGDTCLDAQVNRTDPWVAASKGHLREVEIYAKNTAGSADANMKCHLHPHETPLHQASTFGHADVVQFLLASGANPSAKDSNLMTPLHNAAARGQKHVVQMLIATGAVLDAENVYGRTPEKMARAEGFKEVASIIAAARQAKAKADAADADGGTA